RQRVSHIVNGRIGLKVPADVINETCRRFMKHGVVVDRPELIGNSTFSIVDEYQLEYRGLVEYYRLAYNLQRLNTLEWVMRTSLAKTLAHKLRISVRQVWKRYGTIEETPKGRTKVLQVKVEREGKKPLVAQWGGVTLKRQRDAILDDNPKRVWNTRTEVV